MSERDEILVSDLNPEDLSAVEREALLSAAELALKRLGGPDV